MGTPTHPSLLVLSPYLFSSYSTVIDNLIDSVISIIVVVAP